MLTRENENIVTKKDLLELNLQYPQRNPNIALQQLAKTLYFVPGDGGIKQFIKDFVERAMRVKGKRRLGLTQEEIDNLSEERVIEIVESIFPGKSKQIFAAMSQYPAGFFIYALDKGLKNAYTGSQTIGILQPRLEDTDIDLIENPKNPNELLYVCTFQRFPLAFYESSKPHEAYLEGPLKLVFKLAEGPDNTYGLDFDHYETKNKAIKCIYQGELVNDEAVLPNLDTSLMDSAVLVPRYDCHRYGNNDAQTQFNRDIRMISGAIEKPGDNKIGGDVLRKLYALLYYSDLRYKQNGQWHLWRDNPAKMPIASVLCHGSRVLLQFPAEMREAILDWLFGSKEARLKYQRLAATHGIECLSKGEVVGDTQKLLYESKKPLYEVGADMLYALAPKTMVTTNLQHYGIDLALGGAGEINELSNNKIESNGEHGHLYICSNQPPQDSNDQVAALLIGVEQSSPYAEKDQTGGTHTWTGAHLEYTATGGDDFGKKPPHVTDDYQGLKGYGPDAYYDSLFVGLTPQLFEHIKMMEPSFDVKLLENTGQKIEIAPQIDVKTLKAKEAILLEESNEGLKKTNQELLTAQIDLLAKQDELTTSISELKEEQKTLQQTNSNLIKENELAQTTLQDLQKEHKETLTTTKIALEEQQAELFQVQKAKEEGLTELQQTKESLDQTREALAQVTKQHEVTLATQQNAQTLLEKTQTAQQELSQQTLEAQKRLEELHNQEQQLQQQIAELERQRNQPAADDAPPPHEGEVVQEGEVPPPRQDNIIVQLQPNPRIEDERSFWQKHWKKILVGAFIGAALVVGGVLTGGLVPIIAAGLGIGIGAAAALGFGGAIVVGGALGAGAGCVAGAFPTHEQPGVKAFLNRHKGKIILGCVIAAVIVGSILTGGIFGGAIASAGFLAVIATGISTGVATTVGVSAGVTTAVAGAAIVTTGAAVAGGTTGMLIGALIDKNATQSNAAAAQPVIDHVEGVDEQQPAQAQGAGKLSFFNFSKLANIFKRNHEPPRIRH